MIMTDDFLIFLDFEGDASGNFFLVGAEENGHFYQVVLDKRLAGLANAKGLSQSSIEEFVAGMCARSDVTYICGYSMHERDVIKAVLKDSGINTQQLRYVNLLKAAKSWINFCRRDEFDALPPFRIGANEFQAKRLIYSLASVMRLTNFRSSADYAPGRTTKRFNMGIRGLVRHDQNYEKLTPSQKRDLTQALKHNEFDVRALSHLLNLIKEERPKALVNATYDF